MSATTAPWDRRGVEPIRCGWMRAAQLASKFVSTPGGGQEPATEIFRFICACWVGGVRSDGTSWPIGRLRQQPAALIRLVSVTGGTTF
jgi:hypothetical protein